MNLWRRPLAYVIGLAAACLAAAVMTLPAQADQLATLAADGERRPLPGEAAAAVLCDVLKRADEVHDGLFNAADIAELIARHPYAEVIQAPARTHSGPGLGGPQSVSRILAVFKNNRPAYVFWGDPDFRLSQVLGAPRLGDAPLVALRELARDAPAATE